MSWYTQKMIIFVLCIKLWMSLFKAIGDREAQTTPRGHLDTIKPEDNIPATCLHKSTVLCLKGMVRRGESWSREQSRWHVVWCVLCERQNLWPPSWDKTWEENRCCKSQGKQNCPEGLYKMTKCWDHRLFLHLESIFRVGGLSWAGQLCRYICSNSSFSLLK